MKIAIKQSSDSAPSLIFDSDNWCLSISLNTRMEVNLSPQQLKNLVQLMKYEVTVNEMNKEFEKNDCFFINLDAEQEHETA